ncbi:DUF7848 domain-containing protein [Streptomyces sp. NPDC003006]
MTRRTLGRWTIRPHRDVDAPPTTYAFRCLTQYEDGKPCGAESKESEADDGNHWITGSCWGWCGRSEARVLWMGPAQTTGHVIADLYYCGPCVDRLHHRTVLNARRAVPPTRPLPADRLPQHTGQGGPSETRDLPATDRAGEGNQPPDR